MRDLSLDDVLGDDAATIALLLVVLPVAFGIEFLLYTVAGPAFAILVTLAFLTGFMLVPLWAYMLLDSVPVLSPVLGKLCFTLGAVGHGTAILHQRDDDTYEVLAGSDEWGPDGYWTRLALSRFGVSYERTHDAFETAVKDIDLETAEQNDTSGLVGEKAEVDINRGGRRSFVDLGRVRAVSEEYGDVLLVAIGEKLSEMRDSAGLEVPNRAQMEALEDFGGDSSAHGAKMMAVTTLVFTVLGGSVGYMMFFGL